MQIPAGNSHVRRHSGFVESRELNIQLARVVRLDSRLAAGEKELLQASVPEALDHVSSVTLHDTKRKLGVALVRTGPTVLPSPYVPGAAFSRRSHHNRLRERRNRVRFDPFE